MKTLLKSLGIASLIVAASCDQNEVETQLIAVDDSPLFMDLPPSAQSRMADTRYAVYMAEYITSDESQQVGRTVYFKDVGNKQLGADFVPGLSLDGTDDVSYYIDERRPSADLDVSASSAAIARAMETWQTVDCSDPSLYQVASSKKLTTGFISAYFGFRGSYDYVADLVHAGWLDGDFFDQVAPGGSDFILGVTYTLVFTDDQGELTDVNGDGKADVAWREIYYNDAFSWADGAHYDVETVALHEAGHGLSQGHFGTAFRDAGSGALHFSPEAVMNAAYSGIQTTIGETDNSGHCSIWSNWPNN